MLLQDSTGFIGRYATQLPGHPYPTLHGPPEGAGFRVGLFRFHSQLLTESLLISCTPLSYMLKFRGSSGTVQNHYGRRGSPGLPTKARGDFAPLAKKVHEPIPAVVHRSGGRLGAVTSPKAGFALLRTTVLIAHYIEAGLGGSKDQPAR